MVNINIQIYINGSFYLRDDAKISVFDSGFLLGDGIWEGIRLVKNEWLFIDEHIDRLFEGCLAVDISLDLSRDEIKEAILETQKINNMTDSAHARVMITRGDKIKPFQQPSLSTSGINFIIIMEHSSENPNSNGIKLVTVPQVRGLPMSQDPKLNSHSKLNCIIACIQANKAGGDEALMLDPYGFVNTTNSCNFFIVKNNEFFVPFTDSIDAGVEIENIKSELSKKHGFLKSVLGKLNNSKFVKNAPNEVVELEKKKKDDAEKQIKILEERLNNLSS